MKRSPNLKRQFKTKQISFRTCEHNKDLLDMVCRDTGMSQSQVLLTGLDLFMHSREYDMLVENRRERNE